MRRVFDFALVDYEGRITWDVARDALNRMGVDRYGLNELERRLLSAIIEKFEGGPVGLDALSAAIYEDKDSIEEIVEPYLLQIGFLSHTPYGRIATPLARQHLSTAMDPQPPGVFDSVP